LICQHQLQASRMWTLLNKLLLFIHSLWQGVNPNQQSIVKTAHICVCISLSTTVIHNTAKNSSDNHASYPLDSHYYSDVVYCRWGISGTNNINVDHVI